MVSQKVGPSVMLENHGGVYWCHSRLKTAGNVVRVLVGIVPASRAKVARIEDLRNHYHDVNQEKGVINSHRDYVAWTPQKYWDC